LKKYFIYAIISAIIIGAIVTILPALKPNSFRAVSSKFKQYGAPAKVPLPTKDVHSDQAKNLEILKKKWMEYIKTNPNSFNLTDEHTALAKESVELLLCTRETIELIEFLERNNVPGQYLIFDALSFLFKSSRGIEARQTLISLPIVTLDEQLKSQGKKPNYREQWSFFAGQGCSERELIDFCTSLNDESCVQSAIFGRNLANAKIEPEVSISNTLNALKREVFSSQQNGILKKIVDEFPPDVNYAQIEKLFPPVTASTDTLDPISQGRVALLKKWAATDAIGAVNYVLSVPERMGPEQAATIAGEVARKNPSAGVDLAQQFPEGAYFDAAVGALMGYISESFPTQARELATQIQDKGIRDASLKTITEYEARNAQRAAGKGAK